MIFDITHLAKLYSEILTKLPLYPEVERSSLRLGKSVGESGRTERWYNPRIGRFLYARNPMAVEYPALEQKTASDWTTWMSGAPDECLAMESMARRSSGDVLIGGLGLGILAWLCAARSSVTSVTVVELQQSVVNLIAPVISHTKITITRGDVWQYIEQTSHKFDFVALDTWPDVGSAVQESSTAKTRAARVLSNRGMVRTWLDEIAERLVQTDLLNRSAVRARESGGAMLVEPRMVDNRACDFCGANPFIDCYGFCLECFANTGIRYAAGPDVAEKTRVLMLRASSGELNHLAKPYPEMYEYIIGKKQPS